MPRESLGPAPAGLTEGPCQLSVGCKAVDRRSDGVRSRLGYESGMTVFNKLRRASRVLACDHRLAASHGFEGHKSQFFVVRHDGDGQCVCVGIDQLVVGERSEQLDPGVLGGERPQPVELGAGARNPQRDVSGDMAHRSHEQVDALVSFQSAWSEQILETTAFEPVNARRQVEHLNRGPRREIVAATRDGA
jgi:hypothetical protein